MAQHITVDQEIFAVLSHKLIVVMSELAQGLEAIANEIEIEKLPRAEFARQVRELAQNTNDMAKEMSL